MTKNILIGILVIIVIILGVVLVNKAQNSGVVGANSLALNAYDTTSSGFTEATSTVNTTSTSVFTSIARLNFITNNTTALLTCGLDAIGITAASSTIGTGRGVLIYPSSTIGFGECRSQMNCYPHKGAVNCLASAKVDVNTVVQ